LPKRRRVGALQKVTNVRSELDVGLARGAVLQGDRAKARKAYRDFFALWKDADPYIPILIEAKQEYETLT
jgi:hypothetical protein